MRTRVKLEVQRYVRSRPPRCRSGWHTGPPDFVGVGTVKAGTTWWHAVIAQHPRVFVARMKELHFLSTPDGPHPHEAEAYARFFPRPPGAIAGEWTPDYLYRSHSLPRLQHAAPDARLLVVLRDPVERYRTEVTVFSDVPDWSPDMAFRRGCYAEQLDLLYRLFDREQVLVLQYEQMVADARSELARTFAFLGVDPSFVPADIERPHNVTKRAKANLTPVEIDDLRARYQPDVRRLLEICPELDLALWSVPT